MTSYHLHCYYSVQATIISLLNYTSLIIYLTASTLSYAVDSGNFIISHLIIKLYKLFPWLFNTLTMKFKLPIFVLIIQLFSIFPISSHDTFLLTHYNLSTVLSFYFMEFIKAYSCLSTLMIAILFVWNKPLIFLSLFSFYSCLCSKIMNLERLSQTNLSLVFPLSCIVSLYNSIFYNLKLL
jgi:hypothetical protein